MPAQFRKLGHDRFLPHRYCPPSSYGSTVRTILSRYQARRWTNPVIAVRFPAGPTHFSLLLCPCMSGAPPRLILNRYRGLFLREIKLHGAWSWPFILISSSIENVLNYTSTPRHAFMVWCLTLRRLMSYIYGAPILDVSRSHTTTQHSR